MSDEQSTRIPPWGLSMWSKGSESGCTVTYDGETIAEVPDTAVAKRIIRLPQLEAVARQADQLLSLMEREDSDFEKVADACYRLQTLVLRAGFRTYQPEAHTCPRRMDGVGPWERAPGLDSWEYRGVDRVCSFCGSMHPEDFERFLDRVLTDETCRVEQPRKMYKVYLHAPEVPNASHGAIKYYKWHTLGDKESLERINEKYRLALKSSGERFERIMEEVRENLRQE